MSGCWILFLPLLLTRHEWLLLAVSTRWLTEHFLCIATWGLSGPAKTLIPEGR